MRNARDLLAAYRVPIMLAIVLGLGLYLRLWNIEHLFSIIHDYDEGAYSLAGRFISEGYVPYRDFLFVHPPLHVYLLAGLYKVFGYSFFVGRYLAVVASMGAAVLLFFAGRKLYGARAGLVAAALMAFETQMVYLGRRTVQESVGLFLICVGLVLAADYLVNNRRRSLLLSGIVLGVAVAAKYIMGPAVVGIVAGLAVVGLPESYWKQLRVLGSPLLLISWGCLSLAFYSFLMLLRWVGLLALPVPFVDQMAPGAESVVVVLWVFVLPLLLALLVVIPHDRQRLDTSALRALVADRRTWMMIGCVAAGFFCVTAYFWLTMPGEFLRQTVLLQQSRPTTEFPSLIALVRTFGAGAYLGFLRMSMLPVLFVVPAIILLVNRRDFGRADCFLAVSLTTGLVLCQWLYHLPRYYASLFPLLFLGMSWMLPSLRGGTLSGRSKAGALVIVAALLVSVNVSIVLLRNYTAYDVCWAEFATEEEKAYEETADYLREVGAEKVYAASPAYVAMTSDLNSTLAFDSFALLWLEKRPPEQIVQDLFDEGVDYAVIGSWANSWGEPYREAVVELVNQVRLNGTLVKVIEPDVDCRVEVYQLGRQQDSISNGDLEYWEAREGMVVPVDWNPVLISGDGDRAFLQPARIDGETWVGFHVYEDGIADVGAGATHAGMRQRIAFPRHEILLEVMPGINTESLGETPLGPAVHFLDRQSGHSVVLGFSDELEEEKVTTADTGSSVVVRRPAPLHQWSEHRFDLTEYWRETGWPLPDELTVLVVLSAHSDYPGYYTFHVARVETVQP